MKKQPFVKQGQISSEYAFLRQTAVCVMGNVVYNPRNVLTIEDERAIGFRRDEQGFYRLNLLIRGADGQPLIEIEDDFWTAETTRLYDLICSARGKDLRIVSQDKNTDLAMHFHDYPQEEFRSLLVERARIGPDDVGRFLREIGDPATVPVWTFLGVIPFNNQVLAITDFKAEETTRHNSIESSLFVNLPSVLSFHGGMIDIG